MSHLQDGIVAIRCPSSDRWVRSRPCDLDLAPGGGAAGRPVLGHDAKNVKAGDGRGMSSAESFTMRSPTLPLAAVLVALVGPALTGCELLVAGLPTSSGDDSVAPEARQDGATTATPGCPVEGITTTGDEVCAPCDFVPEPICGVPTTAICESRQDSSGQPCELCLTDAGVVLYDDCRLDASAGVEAARCETVPGATEGEVCTACFDSLGSVVSSTCAPAADRCEPFVADDGRTCSSCSSDDGTSYIVCETVAIDPAYCLAWGNAFGQCVDCFDAFDTRLSHACTPDEGPRVCEQRVQPEGLVCIVCYDAGGFVVEQSCDEGVPQFERCEELTFSEQICTVCVDAAGTPTFVDCRSTVCEGKVNAVAACRSDADCAAAEVCFAGTCTPLDDPGAAEAPADACAAPACTMSRDADGTLCRTCPTSAGDSETRCLGAAVLSCEVLPEDALPAADRDTVDENFGSDGVETLPPADPQGRLCVLCRDRESGDEVYRDCDGNGAVPPPACREVIGEDGSTCTACFDAITGDTVFTSCGAARCHDRADRTLVDEGGVPLRLDGGEAVATCEQCLVDGADEATCRLPARCGDGLFADLASCAGTASLTIAPRRCENPWEAFRQDTGRDDDLAGLLAFALADHDLVIHAATTRPGNAGCTETCGCNRGDQVELVVADVDLERARAVFGPLLRR